MRPWSLLFVFIIVTAITAPVAAQTPTPTSEPPVPVNAGVPNKPVDVSPPSQTFEQNGAIFDILSFTIRESLIPKEFRVPKLDTIANMLKGAVPYLMPKVVQEKTIPQEANLFISGQAILCVHNPLTGETTPVRGTKSYQSAVVPELSDLNQGGWQTAPLFTPYAFKPSAGSYDFRRKPLTLSGPPGCGEDIAATPQESQPVEAAGGVTFADIIMNIIRGVLNPKTMVKVGANIFSKQLTPYSESDYCLVSGCTNQNVNLSYLDTEEANRLQKAGIARAMAPKVLDPTKGERHGSQESLFDVGMVETRTAFTKAIENSGNFIRCSLLPQALQQKEGINCQTKASPSACGDCTTANAECDERAGQYALKPPAVNLGCSYSATSLGISSPTLSGYFESVGNFFGIPPQLLAGIVAIETRGLALTYTESFVQNASRPDPNSYDVNFCKPPDNRNFCGALGIMQVSAPVCMERVEKECPAAIRNQNWTAWCERRNAPAEFRRLPGYSGNPANILDNLVVGASILKNHVGAGCPAKTSLSKQAVMEVGRGYYGNCAGRDTPTPGQYVFPELLDKLSRYLPSGVSASSFIDIPMRQVLRTDGQYSTSTGGLTYCEFLWGYYSTH